jgi:uncharacterized protein (TIGR03118 family)
MLSHRLSHAILTVTLGLAANTLVATTPPPYKVTNLVSDGAVPAKHTDTNLKNPWGISYAPTGLFWVANNGTATSTLYNGSGLHSSLVVSIPSFPGSPDGGTPTGTVFNPTNRFIVKQAAKSGPAQFLFAGEDGVISGWNPSVDPTNAVRMVDRSSSQAIYKGLAMAHNGTSDFLYAANFHNRSIDVFDNKFRPATLTGTFHDETMPSDFAPFNIENIGGKLFVAYAQQDADAHDEVAGAGLGFIDVFNPNGTFVRRLASNGTLNAPWGMAKAPSNFGRFSNDLLVGNFGDGTISAFDPKTGTLKGRLKDRNNHIIKIDGLWALMFGNGASAGKTNALYFTAGTNDEADGLFGEINLAPTTSTSLSTGTGGGGIAPYSLSSSAVPEPASFFTLAAGGLFLMLRRRVSSQR